jgi:glycosyltransferase involved in cell wall biosynthesis
MRLVEPTRAEAPAADPRVEPTLDVSVITPVSAGDAGVAELVRALGAELERLGRTFELLPVFDGVRGPAWEDTRRLAAEDPERVRPLSFHRQFGESVCLAEAFRHARGRVIVTTPQYLQVDPREIERLLAALEAGADLVTPWRHPRVDPLTNRVQSAVFNALVRRVVRQPFHDLNCYFRAIRRPVLEEIAVYGDMYRFLPVIAARAGFRVVELEVRHLKEWGKGGVFGPGVYVRRFLDILGVFFLAKFALKPLRFFGALGSVFLLCGAVLGAIILVQRVFWGYGLWNRPIFPITLLLLFLGVQIIGFGLVGEIIIYAQARNLREWRVERIYESGPAPSTAGAPAADRGGSERETP